MKTIYLDPKMVPSNLRGNYNGKKFTAVVCTETTIPSDAGLWSGGTRERYSVIKLDTGEQVSFPGQASAPWDNSRADRIVKLESGLAVVRHSMFCGKDMGLTFYVHPDNAAKLLPSPAVELSEHERLVLQATCSYKSSYMGRDRYQMARADQRYGNNTTQVTVFPTRDQWDAAKATLIAKGLLNKAGAVTPSGRNAAR